MEKFKKMSSLLVNPQCALVSWNVEGSRMGRWLFLGSPPNVRDTPDVAQVWREQELKQLNQTMWQMQNEIIGLRRGDDLSSRNIA